MGSPRRTDTEGTDGGNLQCLLDSSNWEVRLNEIAAISRSSKTPFSHSLPTHVATSQRLYQEK